MIKVSMMSEKQIITNRTNALIAGVKTPEGKLVVRHNAVSHGIFFQDTLLLGEDGDHLASLQERLITELEPQGEMETILVERIVSSTWI